MLEAIRCLKANWIRKKKKKKPNKVTRNISDVRHFQMKAVAEWGNGLNLCHGVILGKISSLKQWLSAGTGCPGM